MIAAAANPQLSFAMSPPYFQISLLRSNRLTPKNTLQPSAPRNFLLLRGPPRFYILRLGGNI